MQPCPHCNVAYSDSVLPIHKAHCKQVKMPDSKKVSDEEQAIRDKAKLLGIKNSHNKGIDKLIAEIEAVEEAV